MISSGIYGATACCALTATKLGYDAVPFKWGKDEKGEPVKLPWEPSRFQFDAYAKTGYRGYIDIITLAESQREELEPAILKAGYVLVRERMFNGVDCYPYREDIYHNGGLVSLYIKEELPHMSPNHPDFPHDKYVVEKNRIRSRKAIAAGEYGMTTR